MSLIESVRLFSWQDVPYSVGSDAFLGTVSPMRWDDGIGREAFETEAEEWGKETPPDLDSGRIE